MQYARGFTLIEILVVVVIMGILASLVTMTMVSKIDVARINKAKSDLRTIESALSVYRMDNFNYPTTELGLRSLIEKPSEFDAPNWSHDGYIKKPAIDPWGHSYGYESDGRVFNLYSLGSDGKPGGEGTAADINWADL
jgi:general secretion pathway protein G